MKRQMFKWLGVFGVALAMNLGNQAMAQDDFADEFAQEAEGSAQMAPLGLEFSGFLSFERTGRLDKNSDYEGDWLHNQTRLRLQTSKSNDLGSFNAKFDLVEDGVRKTSRVEIREAKITLTPIDWVDLNLGKQVNTWGVGDMLFINDLFPKNWNAMFLGQDMEFMKNPANSYRMSVYLGPLTWDLVSHPEFAPDTTPNGCVLAVYNPNSLMDPDQPTIAQNSASCDQEPAAEVRNGGYDQGELANRLKAQMGGFELAIYSYRGFYKNPQGMALVDGELKPIYPRLETKGLSLEGQLGPGILSMEAGAYDSKDDPEGVDPLIANSVNKGLIGYRLDLSSHLMVGMQLYQEQMQDYDGYEAGILGMYQQMGLTQAQAMEQAAYKYRREEVQNTHTLRLTFKAQQDTLWINLFAYSRPEDRDSFYKLDITKRLNDQMQLVMGANLFEGDENYPDREFGMLADQDNGFLRLQYNF